jgi:hypothetical protein
MRANRGVLEQIDDDRLFYFARARKMQFGASVVQFGAIFFAVDNGVASACKVILYRVFSNFSQRCLAQLSGKNGLERK